MFFLKKLPYGVISRRQFGGRRGDSGTEKIYKNRNVWVGFGGVLEVCFEHFGEVSGLFASC